MPLVGFTFEKHFYLDTLQKNRLEIGLGAAFLPNTSPLSLRKNFTPMVHTIAYTRNFKGFNIFTGYSGGFLNKKSLVLSSIYIPSLFIGTRVEFFNQFYVGLLYNKFIYLQNGYFSQNKQIFKNRTLKTTGLPGIQFGVKF